MVKMINYDRFFSSWSGVAEKIFGCSVIAYEYKILNTRVVIIIFTFPQCFPNTTNLRRAQEINDGLGPKGCQTPNYIFVPKCSPRGCQYHLTITKI